MNKSRVLSALALLAAVCLSSTVYAANGKETASPEDIKQEGQELIQAMAQYSEQQKNEAIKMVNKNLNRMDARVERLEHQLSAQWGELSKETQEELRAQLKSLRAQRIEVAEWLGSMKQDSGEAWNKLKAGFSDAFEDLSRAWQEAEESFEENS